MRPYTLFAITIFLSSFLLFQVQPLLGKHLLPWYGGSSSVWMTALLFFMIALAVGYVYALAVSKLVIRMQLLIHGIVTLATITLIYIHSQIWSSSITPAVDDLILLTADPTWSVLMTLAIVIGLPFVLLSSTSSLLQWWYGYLKNTDPSSLYSISNGGSLLGLLSYPIVFEPLFSTSTQGVLWTVGIAMYVGFLGAVMWLVYSYSMSREPQTITEPSGEQKRPENTTAKIFVVWLLVASVPVMTLLTGTYFMTVAIAPVPFLWVSPLALYLISFIWTFRAGRESGDATFNQVFVLISSITAFLLVTVGIIPVFIMVITMQLAMFSIFHWCHEYLYEIRPHERSLPSFYVALAIGGILGGLAVKLSSLWLLKLPIEFMIILLVVISVVLYHWFPKLPDFFSPSLRKHSVLSIVITAVLVLFITTTYTHSQLKNTIAQERNFYGYKSVNQRQVADNVHLRTLRHGMTIHGVQVVSDEKLQIFPTSYYGYTSGVGRMIEYLRETRSDGLSVAVIGLGTGVLAAYCTSEDEFTFIEIDPEIVFLAREYFSFLSACPQASVVVADGRLAFTKEHYGLTEQKFDVIIIDAYADDMIPVHLLTKEAISLYRQRLVADGFIAIHISSRYLNLKPVTLGVAAENDLVVQFLQDDSDQERYTSTSHWTIFTANDNVDSFSHSAFVGAFGYIEKPPLVWTDTYSALLPIVKLW